MVGLSLFYTHFSSRVKVYNKKYVVLVMLLIISLTPPIAALFAHPCSIATVEVFSRFGELGRKPY